jgi:multiple sugar transport system permease protein
VKVPITWLPETFQFQNYADVIRRFNFGLYYTNTLLVTVSLVAGQIMICALAAYAFTRLHFPGRKFLFFMVLSIMMVPAQMMLIPRFLIANALGWVNSYWGLIVPQLPSAYGVFFLGQFLKTLPTEMEDAGRIDGCSIWRLFLNIALPMSVNGLIAFGIVVTLWSWNELLWPLTVTSSDKMSVLSIGLATLNAMPGYASKYNVLLAASVLITLPMLAVFIAGHKKFVSGIVIGGIKA